VLGYWWVAACFALVAGVGVALGRDRYLQLGHRWDGRRLAVREGSLTRRWTALDPSAVVSYEVRRSPGQARAGLCTIVLHLGQGVGARRVLDVSDAQARALLERLATPLLEPLVAR
jgi:putative membrane protein